MLGIPSLSLRQADKHALAHSGEVMLTTLELRWFAHGTLPAEVEHWFSADCPGELQGTPEAREDVYLYIPCDYLNIKLRQGSLEVKWRKAELGIVRFGNCWQGKVEEWLKWTCDDPTQQKMLPADVLSKSPWLCVEKVRSQRRYQGISYELTQLSFNNDRWWSVAFEMAEADSNQLNNFENIINQVSKTSQGLQLPITHSYAYPHWLSLLV